MFLGESSRALSSEFGTYKPDSGFVKVINSFKFVRVLKL